MHLQKKLHGGLRGATPNNAGHSAPPFATPPTPQLRFRSTAKSIAHSQVPKNLLKKFAVPQCNTRYAVAQCNAAQCNAMPQLGFATKVTFAPKVLA